MRGPYATLARSHQLSSQFSLARCSPSPRRRRQRRRRLSDADPPAQASGSFPPPPSLRHGGRYEPTPRPCRSCPLCAPAGPVHRLPRRRAVGRNPAPRREDARLRRTYSLVNSSCIFCCSANLIRTTALVFVLVC
jgi:hypothetical protein